MRKFSLIAVVMVLTFLLNGCASMTLTDRAADLQNLKLGAVKGNGTHVQASNIGIYFFGLPIVSGSTSAPGYTEWFRDTVNVDSVIDMVTRKGKEMNANYVLDITTTHSPSYWFIYVSKVTVSANFVN